MWLDGGVGSMGESMAVRCPDCGREHQYAPPAYPCACGTPVAPPLNRRAAPTSVTHHTWDEDWVTVRCGGCGRADQWPHPELGCSCGTVLRVPVSGALPARGPPGDAPRTPRRPPAPGDLPARHHPHRPRRGHRRRPLPALAGLPGDPPCRPAPADRDRPRRAGRPGPGRSVGPPGLAARRRVPVADRHDGSPPTASTSPSPGTRTTPATAPTAWASPCSSWTSRAPRSR